MDDVLRFLCGYSFSFSIRRISVPGIWNDVCQNLLRHTVCVDILPSTICLPAPTNFPGSIQLRLTLPDFLSLDDFFFLFFFIFLIYIWRHSRLDIVRVAVPPPPSREVAPGSREEPGSHKQRQASTLPNAELMHHCHILRARAIRLYLSRL